MTTYAKKLGYAGSAEIDGVQTLITSGNFDSSQTPSFLNALDIPATTGQRGRILHADGIKAYNGSVSFDISPMSMALFTTARLLCRRYPFTVGIHDGEDHQTMASCYANSVNLSAAVGGLISASISFMGPSAPNPSTAVDNAYTGFVTGAPDPVPTGYWYSGNVNVRDWTLSMSQDVFPVYGNTSSMNPLYLKVGLVSYSLQVTTYEQLYAYTSIGISTSSFSLVGSTSASGYSFGGQTDLGHYTHTFETAAAVTFASDEIVFS